MASRSGSREGLLLGLALLIVAPGPAACFGQDCRDLEDEAAAADDLTITLRNDSAVTLYVDAGEGCAQMPWRLEQDGKRRKWRRPTCSFSCEAVMAGECSCDDDCGSGAVLLLPPGASHSISWDRSIYVDEDLSLECPAEGCPTLCDRRVVAADASYRLSASASADCIADDGECSCGDGTSACFVAARPGDTSAASATATLVLPDDLGDEVVLALQ
ncbi:MAG: hypothetical protein U0168_01590 [Nannocystaceae bacterium]